MNTTRKSKATQATAMITLAVFTGTTIGCTTPDDIDEGSRQVTTEVTARVIGEGGSTQMLTLGTDTTTLGAHKWGTRRLIVDGQESFDVDSLYAATQLTIPLNDGRQLRMNREGNALRVLGVFDTRGERDVQAAQAPLKELRLGENTVELLRADNTDGMADIIMKISGIEDLGETRRTFIAGLAMTTLVATVEDGEHIGPAAAVAIVAAVVGAAWMAACGALLWSAARACQNRNGFEVKCGGLDVDFKAPRNVRVRFSWSFSRRCL